MDKKEQFKIFISNHPEILEYIKTKEMSFQDFYEIYDIYGENENAWSKYFKVAESQKIKELGDILKNINMDNIEHHVNNAQKLISVIQELTKKTPENITKIENPITKIYGD